MKLEDIKKEQSKGKLITFEISNHSRIPNAVLSNGSVVGYASLSTIKAFKNSINQRQ